MDLALLKLLVTVIFAAVLIIMFLWLLNVLLVFKKENKDMQRNNLDMSGYETIAQVQRKERSVMVVSGLIILICLLFFGGLIYRAIISAASDSVESENIFNLAMVFIPPIFILVLVIKASSHYMRKQQKILKEFRRFQSNRSKTRAEYQQKRRGSESSGQEAAGQGKESQKGKAPKRKR